MEKEGEFRDVLKNQGGVYAKIFEVKDIRRELWSQASAVV